ncbi:MAG: LETM1 domain-containing protein [Vicingaceae bacterium]|nr:LETM1 domain-containing protein [Vicingaceae bacterium]
MSDSDNKDSLEIDIAILEKDGKTEFSEKIRIHKEKTSKAFQDLMINIKTEASETQEASKIFVKYVKEGNVTKEEEEELKTQVYDLLKVLGIGVPFALIPGASLLMPFLIKIASKKGIDLLPTAFNDKKEEGS